VTSATARRRLIVALDVENLREARQLVRVLAGEVGWFKVGKQLFVQAGPDAVHLVRRAGAEAFLDLKFHDIPHTVAQATIEAARLGAGMVNMHAAGGLEMMRCAREETASACRREGLARPMLLAVTVLTSMDGGDLRQVGVRDAAESQVMRLVRLARQAGLDGVVASPREAGRIRRAAGARFRIVTPGVRPSGAARGDQKRVLTPHAAVVAGADYLVVGRPIRDAADPVEAVRAIVREMAGGDHQAAGQQDAGQKERTLRRLGSSVRTRRR
jgi:orotidine-5'-phosphate decarboxylase